MRIHHLAALAVFGMSAMQIADAQQVEVKPTEKTTKARLKGQKAVDVKAALASRLAETRELRDKATGVTMAIGALAASGKLPQDSAGIQTMQQLVDELKKINERLTRIEEEVGGIQGWIEGQNESLPIITQDITDLKKTRVAGYMQTQYRDSDLAGQNDSFRMRRIRLGITHAIDPRTSARATFDLATTNQTFSSTAGTFSSVAPQESQAQLRDAYLTYDIVPSDVQVGTLARLGRQPLPLGYELERSSSDREFPERAQYNNVMFAGERSTGITFKHGTSPNSHVQIGLVNSLTFNDPQQRAVTGAPGDLLAVTAGARYYGPKFDVGVSGLFGKRAEQRFTPPALPEIVNVTNDRKFVYVDGSYIGLFDPKLFIRAEAMFGKDRIPSGVAVAGNDERDMTGHQVMLGYNINPRNQINVRYEQFDPNTDNAGDLFAAYGLSYLYYINPGARVMAAHEVVEDDARSTQKRYGITTLRVQFKF